MTTATDTPELAAELARSAVEAKLAAGAQVSGPLTSYFWHAERFGEGQEWHVVLKTTVDRYSELEAHLVAHHSWQNPEITAVPLAAGLAGYLEWVRATTAGQVQDDQDRAAARSSKSAT